MKTAQEIFNTVATHLLTQNEKAHSNQGGAHICVYKSEAGLKCAIGCLISDEFYKPAIEGIGIEELFTCFPSLMISCGLSVDHDSLLNDLQGIHDDKLPEEWENELRYCAASYELTFNTLSS